MEKRMLCLAAEEDRPAISAVKSAYIRQLYKGYVPEESLELLDPPSLDSVRSPLDTQNTICVFKADNQIQGYIVYGEDPESPGFGIISDFAMLPNCDSDACGDLVFHALQELSKRGLANVHLWMWRSNFRARFLFEQFGFRADGELRTVQHDNTLWQMKRYLFRSNC